MPRKTIELAAYASETYNDENKPEMHEPGTEIKSGGKVNRSAGYHPVRLQVLV